MNRLRAYLRTVFCSNHHRGIPHHRESDNKIVSTCYACNTERELKVSLSATHKYAGKPIPQPVEIARPSPLEIKKARALREIEASAIAHEIRGDLQTAKALRDTAEAFVNKMFAQIS
jgi:hypothetical protein